MTIQKIMDRNVVHLDSNDIPETLPNSHAWDGVIAADLRSGSSGIPVIDLVGADAASEIRRACERWGSFQVMNHGVSGELLEEMERQMRRLFGLPAEQKLRAARPPEGGLGYGVPVVSENFTKMSWAEGFLMMGSPAHHASLLFPDSLIDDFTDVMVTCQKEVNQVSEKIVNMIIESLGVAKEGTKWEKQKACVLSNPKTFVQLNSYPICPDPTRAIGMVPHTDSTMITLLYQSNGADGLQIHVSDSWESVPPIDGALVVFVADLMQILSNGHFKSAFHRVVPSATCHRYSAAFFHVPPDHAEVSPLIQLIDVNNPPLYRSVMVSAWRRFKKNHMYDVFEKVKIKSSRGMKLGGGMKLDGLSCERLNSAKVK